MTVLGKILVFVNLIFSVVVGGLVVVVFTARTHYADALKKEQEWRKLDQGVAMAKEKELVALKAEFAKVETDLKAEKKKVELDLETVSNNYKSLQDKVKTDTMQANTLQITKDANKTDVERRNADVLAMKDRLDAEVKKNTQLVLENAQLTQDTLSAQIQYKAAEEMLKNLESQYQFVAKELARRGGGSAPLASLNPNSKNPPSEKIEGQVTKMDGAILQLSVGSDSGLKKNQTLELFRLGPKPVYLGTVRITDVVAKASVAMPVGKLNDVARIGDQVASHILK